MPAVYVVTIAEKVAERLWSAATRARIAAINIDTIRAACEIAAHYESLTAQELLALEERVLRLVIKKVG